jgi:hypothetical protein
MDLAISNANEIYGTARVTMSSEVKSDHIWHRLPTMELAGDALYESNIQIADMNALNAVLAVQRWKQYLGFYAQGATWHHLEYVVEQAVIATADSESKPTEPEQKPQEAAIES